MMSVTESAGGRSWRDCFLSPVAKAAGFGRSGDEGYTILEVQITVLVLLVALGGVMAQSIAHRRHLGWVEDYGKAQGIVDGDRGRAVLVVSESDANAMVPACKLELVGLDKTSTFLEAEVDVWRNDLTP